MPQLVVPVGPGRNVAIIVEVGAMNWRLKAKGFNAAKDFNRKLIKIMQKNKK